MTIFWLVDFALLDISFMQKLNLLNNKLNGHVCSTNLSLLGVTGGKLPSASLCGNPNCFRPLLLVFQKSMGPPMNGQPLGLVIHGAVSEP